MRSLEESRIRWQITTRHASSLGTLKKAVRSDSEENPCKTGLRSVCWKISLLFQATEITGWSRALADSRSAYTSLREHLLRYIENPQELGSALDPLDNDRNSPWNTLRQDEEIRAEIFQDIERCMPDEPYFRQPRTQRMMLDVLFVFCKINQDVGYRQGMHELLAPILWVVDQDAIAEDSSDQSSGSEADSLLKETLDAAYIEHDAFTLLSLVMRTAKSFYELGEPDVSSTTRLVGLGTPQLGSSPIVERSERIHEVYLARVDPDLAKHLTDIEILPQIFLIRWIRLLFGREFPFNDLLAMWDILLAEDPGLDLVDMVCVAMLLRIRWQLIEAGYSSALMLLLKYPPLASPQGPQSFVDDAIYLRDNFSVAGGAKIIDKYSGNPPMVLSSGPSTSAAEGYDQKQRLFAAKSRLQSPTRFLQQQGGVEALFQGAAKGVFDRGERLGINQAVRDAVGEVKKNMQGLQASRANSKTRRAPDAMRWSLDEGRSVPARLESAMKTRNKQLANMLDEVMADLRQASISKDGDKNDYIKAIDIAAAKVGFVKVYLEDPAMPLPPNPRHAAPEGPYPPIVGANSPSPALTPTLTPAPGVSSIADPETKTVPASEPSQPPTPIPAVLSGTPAAKSSVEAAPETASKKADIRSLDRPTAKKLEAPLPTRASIAQSNFSWMLEPDSTIASSPKSASANSQSPFLKSGRRPNSGTSRDKTAFLFGDDGEEGRTSVPGIPAQNDSEEGFSLGPMKGGGNQE